ncbi:hypothetical protein [Geodermatophilus sabuli]|uniref:Uncharacterized protein n=1 Tax=Geodermatophilus sabuli TaxID=1564158 RepID=A0A285EF10_9ACTN|nr:hypothetical protein [Geodermatophilus sabuli]MBB3086616.1 hypothetical protein [Geodermatophilus sabuli]SNX97732.1 hypothetical protein SAMN06893097_10897 [Geodermatophilus sabuli]
MIAAGPGPAVAPARALSPGRVAAAMASMSVVVHVLVLDASSLGSLAMTVMGVACLPCAWHLWRRPTPGVWRTTATVDGGMLLLHVQGLGGHGHHGADPGPAAVGSPSALMWAGVALVGGQVVLAAVVLLGRRARRRPSPPAPADRAPAAPGSARLRDAAAPDERTAVQSIKLGT